MKTFTFWKICITTTTQGCGAPLCDRATTIEKEPGQRTWRGFAILLTPWRRNRYGESLAQPALVIGWEQ